MECFQIDKRMEVSETTQPESSKVAIEWYDKLQQTLLEIEGNFEIQNIRSLNGNLQVGMG
jgi:hypothetical protein